MTTFWNTNFKRRDYETSNLVAIKADTLPKGFDPEVWKANGKAVKETNGMMRLCIRHQNGTRFEEFGYL